MPLAPSISVIMATFNGERFILEQLESIARQTTLPTELIIGDDCSTDGTLAVASRFAEEAPFRVVIIENNSRLGYGQNFLMTSKHATGNYIAFCDQDDVWLPDKLKCAIHALEETGAHLHVHAATVIDENGQKVDFFTQEIRRRRTFEPLQLPPWGVFYGFSMVFRVEVLTAMDAANRGRHTFDFDGSLSHDLWVYYVATSLGRTVVDDTPLAMYRRHRCNETPNLKGALIDRLSAFFGVRAHPKLRRDVIAAERLRALRAFAERATPHPLQHSAVKASRYWERISQFEALRIEVYQQRGTARRLGTWVKLVAIGGYRSPPAGGLGWRQSVKDGLLGALQVKRKATRADA